MLSPGWIDEETRADECRFDGKLYPRWPFVNAGSSDTYRDNTGTRQQVAGPMKWRNVVYMSFGIIDIFRCFDTFGCKENPTLVQHGRRW
jgi:hypothetical protein